MTFKFNPFTNMLDYSVNNGDYNSNYNIQPETSVTIGPAGAIVFGDSTERDMYPQTTLKENLGTATNKFNYIRGDKLEAYSSFDAKGEAYGTPLLLAYNYYSGLTSSRYLYTAYPTTTAPTRGYVMERDGSIVGNAVSCDVYGAVSGYMEIQVRINGTEASDLTLTFDYSGGTGDRSEYTTVSRGDVTFSQGDIISFYALESGDMSLRYLTGVMRIIYDD